ncbi:MAG TPA: capsule assembly Wzi family protein [Terriglobales bacterium]|jgi:membrane-associated phospholipid phosphatase
MTSFLKAAVIVLGGAIVAYGQARSGEATETTPSAPSSTLRPAPSPFSQYEQWGLLPPGADPHNRLGFVFLRHVAEDQKSFWTAPLRLRKQDLKWGAPFLAFSGALMASDSWLTRQLPDNPRDLKRSDAVSNYAVYSLVGAAGGSYLWGHLTRNDHLEETGLLSAEAAINSTISSFALKEITQRPRPQVSGGSARFFRGGSSFPSEHAAIAWSVAGVVAHEYPGPLTKLFAYGLATGVTIARVTSEQHFASDAFLGSALGWYLARQVYRARHDPEIGGTAWGASDPSFAAAEPGPPRTQASPDVPVDSWVYPALQRLAALGYVQNHFLGQRPWTRMQCANLLEEAAARIPEDGEAAEIYAALRAEFFMEEDGAVKPNLRLDSIYTRITGISGPPLADSYNFASTIVNDDGRPFQQGVNSYTGASASGSAGPLAFYVRAEYQHAPSAPAFPLQVREAVAGQLGLPVPGDAPFSEINRGRILEGYVSLAFRDLQFSFGKQSLWWGPTQSGPLNWSTNAEPITMLRVATIKPFKLPSILAWLGPVETESFIGQVQGHHFILRPDESLASGPLHPQPFIHGEKISFKPTPNLELGFSRTVMFAGEGHPFTTHSFLKSFFSVGTDYSGPVNDAGDRHSGFDFSYRLPYLRKWATLYADSFCEDDVLSLSAPQRCAWSPGLYLPQIPKIPRLDLRLEGVYTDVSGFPAAGVNYTNNTYRSGYTNHGNILGSWVGRDGRGLQLWSNYWLSPRSRIQFGYRHQGVAREFLDGGHLNDFSVQSELVLRPTLALSAGTQYEYWNFPLFGMNTRSNWSTSLAITFRPNWLLKRR